MKRTAAFALISTLAGCSFAPTYKTPVVEIPSAFKEAQEWQTATPADQIKRGEWWLAYGDKLLDELEAKVDIANPNLAAAADRYAQARTLVTQAQAARLPLVNAGALSTNNRQSDHRPLRSSSQPDEYGNNDIGMQISYELDLWGRVRNQVAVNEANAQASAADLESVRLSLHAELATDYIALRGFDAEHKLLLDTLDAYARALKVTANRHSGGIGSGLDEARAQTQLDNAKAQISDVATRRALLEHAIASLTGMPASEFSISLQPDILQLPIIPTGLPSTLLQRRPDIAAAERRTAASNQQIGIARAAFFPSITLNAQGGYQNTGGNTWLSAPNTYWSLGPGLLLNLFDGGRRRAEVERARLALDESSQRYRAEVLNAFQQVEDNLALLDLLAKESSDENAATVSATHTLDLAQNRYDNGAVSYLEVIESQTAALQAQRTALSIRTRQLQSSVGLIKAIGGGWSSDLLGESNASKTAQTMTPAHVTN
ncbi:efflux transporter outer membrane subunit [Pseudolysobacter antarcticus]|uniref:Efflux transporter outer membrane subunit n=1 Tax=Pseudolysobacter antarcticus TaxID=2511995 RepID=A0A411HLM8_9GAMM|nr:efflux transporter outer membrane subunit [Pseudolysobacter antarcticus]QBB71432.1 efflux transporter outer membrane subunit [Pseudolysobacter antarcticus]